MPALVVVDASALVEVLLRTGRAAAVTQAVVGARMVAPDLINVEILSTLRRLERGGVLSTERGLAAVDDLEDAPIDRVPTGRLSRDIWALRGNMSAYDASYVALAQMFTCPLVTGDARLSRAPGLQVPVIVA